jgi:hypothetical protein
MPSSLRTASTMGLEGHGGRWDPEAWDRAREVCVTPIPLHDAARHLVGLGKGQGGVELGSAQLTRLRFLERKNDFM